jgi:hypothetical protein
VNRSNIPETHPDRWVDLTRGYVTEAILALTQRGFQVDRSWLDPRDPRDATILYTPSVNAPSSESTELRALVWDEETGWRDGRFDGGRPGVRTALDDVSYLGGGPLIEAGELAHRVLEGHRGDLVTYRSYRDVRDGFDDTLRNGAGSWR